MVLVQNRAERLGNYGLDLRLRRGQFAGFTDALKTGAIVGAVAERLVFRVAAAAE